MVNVQNKVTEGKAKICLDSKVFYNPKMESLRNISVAFLKAVGSRGRLLDATAATGVRAIRYAKECGIRDSVALDMNKSAYTLCKKNIRLNKLDIKVYNKSIQEFAGSSEGRFDIIDLDPFGSPAPCMYDILKLCKGGTTLMVTATDTAVLCGAHAKACLKLYGAKPLHNELCKEVGLRILLGYTARTAAQFNFGIRPVLSISDMHYMRIFVEITNGATEALESIANIGLGAYCGKCMNRITMAGMSPLVNPICSICGARLEGFGPLWTGNIYEKGAVRRMLQHSDEQLLKTIDQELDTPMFYSVPKITKKIGTGSISHYKLIDALRKRGYKATATQFDRDAIKTDADMKTVMKAAKELA